MFVIEKVENIITHVHLFMYELSTCTSILDIKMDKLKTKAFKNNVCYLIC